MHELESGLGRFLFKRGKGSDSLESDFSELVSALEVCKQHVGAVYYKPHAICLTDAAEGALTYFASLHISPPWQVGRWAGRQAFECEHARAVSCHPRKTEALSTRMHYRKRLKCATKVAGNQRKHFCIMLLLKE